jgi:hypothetical protein
MVFLLFFYLVYQVESVQYFYRLTPGAEVLDLNGDWIESSASYYDDFPMQELKPSHTFFYYGQYRSLYINPNGAIHFDRNPPCCSGGICSFGISDNPTSNNNGGCNFNTSYANLIGGFVTDLNPSYHSDAQIFYRMNPNMLSVWYYNIPQFGDNGPTPAFAYNFAILLSQNGNIQILYYSVQPPQHDTPYLVGLRGPSNISPSDANKALWHTTVNGTYPLPSEVHPNSTLDFCAMETSFCLSSMNVPLAGGFLHLLAHGPLQSLSCLAAAAWARFECVFASNSTAPLLLSPALSVVSCLAPPGAAGSFDQVQIRRSDTREPVLLDADSALEFAYDAGTEPPPPPCTSPPADPNDPAAVSCIARLAAHVCSRASCAAHNGAVCARDCAGVPGGSAARDSCQVKNNERITKE